jgi:hypothetical protein
VSQVRAPLPPGPARMGYLGSGTQLCLPVGISVTCLWAVDDVVLVGSSEGIVHVVTRSGALVSRFSTLHLGVLALRYISQGNWYATSAGRCPSLPHATPLQPPSVVCAAAIETRGPTTHAAVFVLLSRCPCGGVWMPSAVAVVLTKYCRKGHGFPSRGAAVLCVAVWVTEVVMVVVFATSVMRCACTGWCTLQSAGSTHTHTFSHTAITHPPPPSPLVPLPNSILTLELDDDDGEDTVPSFRSAGCSVNVYTNLHGVREARVGGALAPPTGCVPWGFLRQLGFVGGVCVHGPRLVLACCIVCVRSRLRATAPCVYVLPTRLRWRAVRTGLPPPVGRAGRRTWWR